MKYAIFDLDSCTIDDHWRLHMINWEKREFKEYHDCMVEDEDVIETGATLLRVVIAAGITPVFFTARPDSHRTETVNQIRDLLKVTNQGFILHMRAVYEEGVPAKELKSKFLSDLLSNKNATLDDIVIAIDDHREVVNMYIERGIPAWCVTKDQAIFGGTQAFLASVGQKEHGIEINVNSRTSVDFAYCNDNLVRHDSPKLNVTQVRIMRNWRDALCEFFPASRTSSKSVILPGSRYNDVSKESKDPLFLPIEEPTVEAPNSGGRKMPSCPTNVILEEAAATFKERNAVYKDNGLVHARIMKAMFPNGVELNTEEDFHMWHIFDLMIVKLSRFSNSSLTHQDSIRDLTVYAAMAETLIETHNIKVK